MLQLNDQVRNVLPALPAGLQEGLVRLLSRDPRKRPTAQLLSGIKFFRYMYLFIAATWPGLAILLNENVFIPSTTWRSDPVVHALQFLDVINMKDPSQKSHFYRATLTDILPAIPKVRSFLNAPHTHIPFIIYS
jgi:SCY1-like protein 2